MEEWFPGLLDVDICGEGETLLKKWALYSFEDGEEHRKILLDDLLKKAEEGDLLVNSDQPKSTIPIAQIAPDLILADLPRNIMLNTEELEFDQRPEFLLGDGGFGSVYHASYGGEEVAVKIFNKHTSLRLLRQDWKDCQLSESSSSLGIPRNDMSFLISHKSHVPLPKTFAYYY
ncbi:UNVERIFIED_CONTAM: Leucine-rich repeat serine/threonine-protein kinase 2 [Gekko kuhli]